MNEWNLNVMLIIAAIAILIKMGKFHIFNLLVTVSL